MGLPSIRFALGDQIGPPPSGGYKLQLNSSKTWVCLGGREWWQLAGSTLRARRAIEGAENIEELRIGLEMSGAELWDGPLPD